MNELIETIKLYIPEITATLTMIVAGIISLVKIYKKIQTAMIEVNPTIKNIKENTRITENIKNHISTINSMQENNTKDLKELRKLIEKMYKETHDVKK